MPNKTVKYYLKKKHLENGRLIENQRNLKDDLLKNSALQFSENQRAKETSPIKILGLVGGIIIGYSYVYSHYLFGSDGIDYDFNTLTLVTIASCFLLFIGGWVTTIIAYSFRREQFINSLIKTDNNLMFSIYPANYNPLSIYTFKKAASLSNLFMKDSIKTYLISTGKYRKPVNFVFLRWMPDLYIAYFLLFPFFILVITAIYFIELNKEFEIVFIADEPDYFLTLSSYFIITSLFVTLFAVPTKYSNKLLKRYLIWCKKMPFGLLSNRNRSDIKKINEYLSVDENQFLIPTQREIIKYKKLKGNIWSKLFRIKDDLVYNFRK